MVTFTLGQKGFVRNDTTFFSISTDSMTRLYSLNNIVHLKEAQTMLKESFRMHIVSQEIQYRD